MPIVLVTDFGVESYWVPQLKGIVYTNYPYAEVIDATHEISPFDVREGAFILSVMAKQFPQNMVFIAIIAPGSPLEERYLVLTTSKDQIFLGPDNGLFTHIINNFGIKTLYHITNHDLFAKPLESLFPSQILGKVGALIASGYRPEDVGPAIDDHYTFDIHEAAIVGDRLRSEVVLIDHFGNCVTNIPKEMSDEFGMGSADRVRISTPDTSIEATFGHTYGDVPKGEPVLFINRLDLIELAINMGNFSKAHNIKTGTRIEIEIKR